MEILKLKSEYKDIKTVEIFGWIRNNRNGKNVSFITLNDGTCFDSIQVVYKDDLSNFEEVSKLNIPAAIKVVGEIIITDKPDQPFEIKATEIEVLADSESSYPLQPKKHSYEFLREIAHLRARSNTFSAVFRIRSKAAYAIHKYFNENGFIHVHTPIITSGDAEGAGEMFRVSTEDEKEFFGKETHLTVSGQLQGESYAMAFQKIYTFGPTFRAEHSHTTRHASEFWMMEPEVAFADNFQNMDLAEDMIKYIFKFIIETCPEDLKFLSNLNEKDLVEIMENIINSDFNRITYTEAIEILQDAVNSGTKFENKVEWGIDLATEHEKYLTDVKFKSPVFVRDYPKDIKAFYMYQNDDGKTVAAMDMLVPGIGELMGGSQRETRLDLLKKRMDDMNVSQEELDWYLDLRRFGGVTHSGFGLGFERLVMYITGMENIRDVIPFPRTPNNAQF